MPSTSTARPGQRRLPQPVAAHREHVRRLAAEQEHAVRVRRDGEQRREHPERPAPRARRGRAPRAARACTRASRRGRGCTSARRRRGRGTASSRRTSTVATSATRRPGEPAAEHRDERQARERERRRGETQAAEAEAEVRDGPRDEEVQRRAAAVAGHVLDDAGERVATDEERERLVLVRRPGHQLVEEEGGRRERHAGDSEPEPALGDPGARRRARAAPPAGLDACLDPLRHRVSATLAGRLAVRCRSTSTVARTGTRSRCSSG